jgi:hypothetical protein
VEFRGDLDASADIVEQDANLISRVELPALGNRSALKANDAAQADQVAIR